MNLGSVSEPQETSYLSVVVFCGEKRPFFGVIQSGKNDSKRKDATKIRVNLLGEYLVYFQTFAP